MRLLTPWLGIAACAVGCDSTATSGSGAGAADAGADVDATIDSARRDSAGADQGVADQGVADQGVAADATIEDTPAPSCIPSSCPQYALWDACCVDESGPCGRLIDGECVPKDPCQSCTAGSGAHEVCCKVTNHVQEWVTCGFDYGYGCVYGPEQHPTCPTGPNGGCKAPHEWETLSECCPDVAGCGDPTKCGVRSDPWSRWHCGYGTPFCGTDSTLTWGFPTGCVERDQPGVPDSSCPWHFVWLRRVRQDFPVWFTGTTVERVELLLKMTPGCRRPGGECGFDFGEFGMGCIDADLVTNEKRSCEPELDAGDGSDADASDAGQL